MEKYQQQSGNLQNKPAKAKGPPLFSKSHLFISTESNCEVIIRASVSFGLEDAKSKQYNDEVTNDK
jgi:hypothetical protein